MGLGLEISTPVGASPRLSSESVVSPTERGRESEEAEAPLVRSVSWAEEGGLRSLREEVGLLSSGSLVARVCEEEDDGSALPGS